MADPDNFQSYRPLLFAIAYRMLGSASEADDVLQDAYLRYATAQAEADGRAAEIRSLKAYLSTIVTRLCLDRLKAARTAREQYLGPWLPEPVLLQAGTIDPQNDAERHESISIAFLLLLEALAPQERAVFLLREVFEYEYAEIGRVLGLNAANCRQIFHRAKEHIAERRPRFRPAPDRQRELVSHFLAATQHGDVQGLANMLAQDVSYTADGGGKVAAAQRPVHGRTLVSKLLIKLAINGQRAVQAAAYELQLMVAEVNGEPAVLFWVRERLDTVFILSLGDEQITAIHAIRNPDKLVYIERQLLKSIVTSSGPRRQTRRFAAST